MSIQQKSTGYNILKRYVDFMFKHAYRRVEYCGKENIPSNGAIIYAPNHSNTLMDALAVLSIDRQAKVFVARADIFRNSTLRKILTFLKMLPINRRRDGWESLKKNENINNTVVEALHARVPFCILPEGTHRPMHSLMPLQKGIFRIAMQASEAFGKQMPVYIVPVGIEFGHFFRFRSSLLLQIGKPINVTQYLQKNNPQSEALQINELRDILSTKIKQLILHIPDDENYTAILQTAQCTTKEKILKRRFEYSKENIAQSMETRQNFAEANSFFQKRHLLGVGMESLLNERNPVLILLGRAALLLLGLPYFFVSAVMTSPVTLLSVWLCSKLKDKAFHNSVRFVVSLIFLPLLLLLGIGITATFAWQYALVFALLFLPAFIFLHEYLRGIRLLISDIKRFKNKDLMLCKKPLC